MAEIPKVVKLAFGSRARWHTRVNVVYAALGFICLIMGIVGDAANRTLGLEPTNWFIMALIFGVWDLYAWLCAYTAAKEG